MRERRILGWALIVLGLVLVPAAFVSAHRPCPAPPSYNGTGPPPPPPPACAEGREVWTGLAIGLGAAGVLSIAIGIVLVRRR